MGGDDSFLHLFALGGLSDLPLPLTLGVVLGVLLSILEELAGLVVLEDQERDERERDPARCPGELEG